MEKKKKTLLINTLFIPILFILIMWGVKILEHNFGYSFIKYGVLPKDLNGLKGILISPFIHKDFGHLINNTYPILILGGMLYFFYQKIATQILLWLFFISGLWLWVIGRPVFHIGASGIIYALASFIFVSGIIRKNPRLSAVSLVITFLYGGLFWGILPIKNEVSWEGHLAGFFAGILVAFYFKNEGPSPKKYQWEIDEKLEKESSIDINYIYKKNN